MRELITEQLEKAILGPFEGEKEVLKLNPFQFYFTGILYPQSNPKKESIGDVSEALLDDDLRPALGDDERSGKETRTDGIFSDSDELDDEILSTDFNPSALGLSFSVPKKASFDVKVTFGKYVELKDKNKKEEDKTAILGYERNQYDFNIPVEISGVDLRANTNDFENNGAREEKRILNLINKDHKLKLQVIVREVEGDNVVTVSLVNEAKVESGKSVRDLSIALFQVSLKIINEENDIFLPFIDRSKYSKITDPEEVELKLLYKDYMNFASGHGVSVIWSDLDNNEQLKKSWVGTSHIPAFEVMGNDFNPKELKEEDALDVLFIKPLAGKAFSEDGLERDEMCNKLESFIKVYLNWIQNQRDKKVNLSIDKLPISDENKAILKARATFNLEKCEVLYKRMLRGIQLLRDEDVKCFEAFCDANRAMYMQRYFGSYTKYRKEKLNVPIILPGEHDVQLPDSSKGDPKIDKNTELYFAKWRPFQLAFLLSQLEGLIYPESEEREQVDLIWFSTGGGKTEAYLGLIAMYLFYRRLRNKNNPDEGAGVTVFMRYTLRLLIKDQYDRAIPLILACDLIRRQNTASYGETPYSIGIWVGQSLTPNKNNPKQNGDLDTYFKTSVNHLLNDQPQKARYKLPIEECPCCGTKIIKTKEKGKKKLIGEWGIKGHPTRTGDYNGPFVLFCTNKKCEYSLNRSDYGFPIYYVDEDIYRERPSLVFSTVDKFAALNWDDSSFQLFNFSGSGSNLKRINEPPELIIQDELHLISSALGTIYGVYEIGISELMSKELDDKKTYKPKIIAATATAKHAERQCRILYGRKKFSQFPPPGISADDSFFARKEKKSEKKHGRLYLGVQPTGFTNTTAQVRLVSLFNQLLPGIGLDNDDFDKYYTSLIYFNTVKELGKFRTLLMDDIPSRSKALSEYFSTISKGYVDDEFYELSSQMKADDIAKNLNDLGKNKLYPITGSLYSKGIRKYSDFLNLNEYNRRVTFKQLFNSKEEFDKLDLNFESDGDPIVIEEINYETFYQYIEAEDKKNGEHGIVPQVVAATNMVAVGIDIARFNLMQITGQPKSHSEYIQASSRAGRTYPGIVITTFNPAKNRDRSHYESFVDYHQAFYKHVESTSVTPYSEPALEKALDAVVFFMAMLFKYNLEDGPNGNVIPDGSGISDFIDSIEQLIIKRLDETVTNYHGIKAGDIINWKRNVKEILNKLKSYWIHEWNTKGSQLFYPDYGSFYSKNPKLQANMNNCLFAGSNKVISVSALRGKRGVMNSLRNVELQSALQIGKN
jgi:hypothetical protein